MGNWTEAALRAKPILQKGAQSLSDEEALKVKGIYDEWAAGVDVKVHEKQLRNGRLYRCSKAHTTQADWPPELTPDLWEGIDETHAGTLDEPIPYEGNMALENGKYYSQGGVVYLCTRDTGNPVYHELSALVGLYVEEVST